MSCHVATFAKDPGPAVSCHVATFAKTLETNDIDTCLKYRTNLVKGNRSQVRAGRHTLHARNILRNYMYM